MSKKEPEVVDAEVVNETISIPEWGAKVVELVNKSDASLRDKNAILAGLKFCVETFDLVGEFMTEGEPAKDE